MKTCEFKLYLSKAQKQTIDFWMSNMRWVWNNGNFLIKEFEKFNYYHMIDKKTYPCCPIREYSSKNKAVYLACPIGWILEDFDSSSLIYGVRLSPKSRKVERLNFFGIQPAFTHKEHKDKPWLTEVPSKFIDGCIKNLAESLEASWKQKDRESPKFKGRNKKINTLIHNNSYGIKIKGDKINIPKLGYCKAKGLSQRWDSSIEFCPLKIVRYPSGYYLQISGEVNTRKPIVKKKRPTAGLDAGVARFITDDLNKGIEPPKYLKQSLAKLAKLQRKAARQKDHPDNAAKKQQDCKNLQKTYKRIAKIHERIRRQRRAFNHFHSTKYTNQFEEIKKEDLNLRGMTKAPKPKMSEDGKGYVHNGRKRKAGLNRSLLDAGIGQLYQMIELKAKATNTKIVNVNPRYTSTTCSKCGHISPDNRKTQKVFQCVKCNFTANADHNAAINIKRGRGVVHEAKS